MLWAKRQVELLSQRSAAAAAAPTCVLCRAAPQRTMAPVMLPRGDAAPYPPSPPVSAVGRPCRRAHGVRHHSYFSKAPKVEHSAGSFSRVEEYSVHTPLRRIQCLPCPSLPRAGAPGGGGLSSARVLCRPVVPSLRSYSPPALRLWVPYLAPPFGARVPCPLTPHCKLGGGAIRRGAPTPATAPCRVSVCCEHRRAWPWPRCRAHSWAPGKKAGSSRARRRLGAWRACLVCAGQGPDQNAAAAAAVKEEGWAAMARMAEVFPCATSQCTEGARGGGRGEGSAGQAGCAGWLAGLGWRARSSLGGGKGGGMRDALNSCFLAVPRAQHDTERMPCHATQHTAH